MKVFLDSIGCRLNQAEVEAMGRQFRAEGHEIVATASQADMAVVNTCSVTSKAAADSRGRIRKAARAGDAGVIATGCWATLQRAGAASMPQVVSVVTNARKETLVRDALQLSRGRAKATVPERLPLPGPRWRTRAFVKVQDGCDNHCTFCVTTLARGASRSVPVAEVLQDVQAALSGGAREVVLTGVQLGAWGFDLGMRLPDLVRAILRETDAPRIRLSSLEPWDLDASFFELWQDARLCAHFHLPLQSGCTNTLKRMRRRTTPAAFRGLVEMARAVRPDAAVTTDVIAGFPGETETDFRQSLDFVREMQFAGGHAFPFSSMAGTAASRMSQPVPSSVRRHRNHMYLEVFAECGRRFRTGQQGRHLPVLWESAERQPDGGYELSGLTDNYIRVRLKARTPRWNVIEDVRLGEETGDGLQGIMLK